MADWIFPDGQKLSDYAKKAAANTFTGEQTVEADIHITDAGATNTRGVYFRSADHVHGIWFNGTTANDLIMSTYETLIFQLTRGTTTTIFELFYDGTNYKIKAWKDLEIQSGAIIKAVSGSDLTLKAGGSTKYIKFDTT